VLICLTKFAGLSAGYALAAALPESHAEAAPNETGYVKRNLLPGVRRYLVGL
jgi:hypothetical protein